MISVAIIGSGNLATNLIEAFLSSEGVRLKYIYSRNKNVPNKWKVNSIITKDFNEIKHVDVSIITVSDNAISEISEQIFSQLVVHTSGSIPLTSLKNTFRKGIFYPLQTFTKDNLIDFKDVPFCLESEEEKDMIVLEKLTSSIGSKYYHINSEQRKFLHLSAVFANNFTNHLYGLAKEICENNKVPFEILQPIIKNTVQKVTDKDPFKIQTGPAVRNDYITIKKHLNLLNPKQKELYKILTKSIQDYGKEL